MEWDGNVFTRKDTQNCHDFDWRTTICAASTMWIGTFSVRTILENASTRLSSKAATEHATRGCCPKAYVNRPTETTDDINNPALTTLLLTKWCVWNWFVSDSDENRYTALSGACAETVYPVRCVGCVEKQSVSWFFGANVHLKWDCRTMVFLEFRWWTRTVSFTQLSFKKGGLIFDSLEVTQARRTEYEWTSRMTLTIRLQEKNITLTRSSITSQETVFQESLKCFHVWVNEENF